MYNLNRKKDYKNERDTIKPKVLSLFLDRRNYFLRWGSLKTKEVEFKF
tara:strand:- start:5368 stop:5511 length:144 start_codon:yes stop_codon:yes gene_type:complete